MKYGIGGPIQWQSNGFIEPYQNKDSRRPGEGGYSSIDLVAGAESIVDHSKHSDISEKDTRPNNTGGQVLSIDQSSNGW